jgi:ParB-like chromosome segregation protein Spo0J
MTQQTAFRGSMLKKRLCRANIKGEIVRRIGQLASSQEIHNSTYLPVNKPACPPGDTNNTTPNDSKVVTVPLLSLRPADSPRLNGEDKAHIARLAETEAPLPPILVDRRTMRVIDGMHRLMAASLQGRESIDVIFYDGTEADVFLYAVRENVAHGLPLSQADRRAGAERIIDSHPHLSDRAIGQVAGLAAKTVAAIRKRSTSEGAQSAVRMGRDGKLRPIDSAGGRKRAAELLINQSSVSLRDVARECGISPATVLDVRKRLERGESPVPARTNTAQAGAQAAASAEAAGRTVAPAHADRGLAAASPDPAATVEQLLRDPSLRSNEQGKRILRLLHHNAVSSGQLPDIAITVPPHCVTTVMQLAHQYAKMWHDFARELDGRARIIDPIR